MDSKKIKSLKLTNFTEICNLTNEKKYDIDNLYNQFVDWSCNGTSGAPLNDYMDNPMYQELIPEDEYFDVKSDERLYLDLRASSGYVKEAEKRERKDSKITLYVLLKQAAMEKLRLRVCSYSLGEYIYILRKNELTLRHRTYTINQTDADLLE